MEEIEVPVLIVGGGGCGLTLFNLLSDLGVESLMLERHATPSPMPKARALNRRTLEVFRQHGLDGEISRRGMSGYYASRVRWMTSFGGDSELSRRVLYEMDAFGGGKLAQEFAGGSPFEYWIIFPQVRLEPFLREQAQNKSAGRMAFNTELVELEQTPEEVRAVVRDRASERRTLVRARYVVAADAGRTVGPIVGARLEGTAVLHKMITVYFKADLSKHIDNDHLTSIFFINPDAQASAWGSGVMGKIGPPYDRHCREWLLHSTTRPGDPERFDEATLIGRIRDLLRLPELQIEILGNAPWIVQGMLANRYRFGRVFVAGDAAHRHPPSTGLGLNSGIQDAHNLAWKLAAVVRKQAGDGLLDSYESERRPVAERNVRWAMFAFSNSYITGPAMGIDPGDPEQSRTNLLTLLADSDEGRTRRWRLDHVMQVNNVEFQAKDLEIGFRYEKGALVPDGTQAPERDPTGRRYTPTTRPGHRLPHAWLRRGEERISTLDLVKPGRWLLLLGKSNPAWLEAARTAAAATGIALEVVSIGDGEYADEGGEWRAVRGIEDSGALLVRPDQHVAWRCPALPASPARELQTVLQRILSTAA